MIDESEPICIHEFQGLSIDGYLNPPYLNIQASYIIPSSCTVIHLRLISLLKEESRSDRMFLGSRLVYKK